MDDHRKKPEGLDFELIKGDLSPIDPNNPKTVEGMKRAAFIELQERAASAYAVEQLNGLALDQYRSAARHAASAYAAEQLNSLALDQYRSAAHHAAEQLNSLALDQYRSAAHYAEELLASAVKQSELAAYAVDQLNGLDLDQHDKKKEGEGGKIVVIDAQPLFLGYDLNRKRVETLEPQDEELQKIRIENEKLEERIKNEKLRRELEALMLAPVPDSAPVQTIQAETPQPKTKREKSGEAKDLVTAMLDAYQGTYNGGSPSKPSQLLAFSGKHKTQGYGEVFKSDSLVKWDGGCVTYRAFARAFGKVTDKK